MFDQAALEQEMADLGRRRYRKGLAAARAGQRESQTRGAGRILKQAVIYYEAALREWIRQAQTTPGPRHAAVPRFDELPIHTIAVLSAATILDGIGASNKMTRMAHRISRVLEDEIYFEVFAKQNATEFAYARKRASELTSYERQRRIMHTQGRKHSIDYAGWDHRAQVSVGVVCIEVFARSTGLIEIKHARVRKKTVHEVAATEEGIRAIEQAHRDAEDISPVYLPCIERPRPWTDPLTGGFLSSNLHKRALVKTDDRGYITELAEHPMPDVYEAVNALQSTAFSINAKVYEVMQHAWEHDIALPQLPQKDHLPLPARPEEFEEDADARKAWRKAARKIHEANDKSRAARLRIAKILYQAGRFLGMDLYYVQQLDFRGRSYTNAYYLHPQGEDKCRALLSFARGKPIVTDEAQALYYVHGANCWGVDKLSYEDRLRWVEDNGDLIQRIAEDPWDNQEWTEADAPWSFLAWCFDFVSWLKDPVNHRSAIPVAMDATQSGLQILSMLLRDERGAAATNCIPADRPQDLYQQVANETLELVRQDLDGPHEALASYWLSFGINRSAAKRPTMTRVYNSTQYSCRDYVAEWFNTTLKERGEVTWETLPTGETFTDAVNYMSAKLWLAMDSVTSGAKQIMDWLRAVAVTFSSLDLPVEWETPIGFKVRQNYKRWKNRVIRTRLGRVYRAHSIRIPGRDTDARRCRQALAPNVIHSLDGAAMMRTVQIASAGGVESFAMVHDSFACPAADAPILYAATREAFASMFTPDVLGDLREQFLRQLPEGVTLPELPERGSFDPAVIRESPYFFC